MEEKWIISARSGFAVGGEILELFDDEDELINLQNLTATMRILGWNRAEEFSTASGNFSIVPPIAPAIVPTAWEFKMTALQVNALNKGRNDFEVLIADQLGVLIGEIQGSIEKRD